MLKNYVKLIVAILFVSNVMAQNTPSYVPKDGLVGWWPFNGNGNDESGNGNHGTVSGATLTNDRHGLANSAYSFDGSSKITIQHSNTLNVGNEMTICVWFKQNTMVNTINYIIQKGTGGGCANTGYSLSADYNFGKVPNGMKILTYGQNNNCASIGSDIQINTSWHSMIVIYAPNTGNKLYIDGQLINGNYSVCNNCKILNSTNPLIIGGYYSKLVGSNWNGLLDDIAIFNRALSDQEVKQLYAGCTKETATSSSFNSYVFTNNNPVNLSATPSGGAFSGEAVTNNTFEPSKAKLGKNQVTYNFKNSTGCADSTNFNMILVDTLGNKCSTYDTILKINFKLTTGIKAGQLTSINVYPNPASELLIIEANDIQALGGYKYKIVDLQGKEVYNALATSTKTEISLKSIGAKGMYIIHIVDEKGVSIENKKIVLE